MTRVVRALSCAATALVAFVLSLAAPACGGKRRAGEPGAVGTPPATRQPLLVFAAASLAGPFAAVEKEFEAAHPNLDVQCNFAGTPQLVLQLREGAPADVFASADEPNMAKVVGDGRIEGTPRLFAKNRLAIVVKAGNAAGIQGLADLARPGHKVALCGPEVPAGRYARVALDRAKVIVQSLSDEPNVKALVGKVQLGELNAGIVYATDTKVAGVAAVPIPDEHQVIAAYPIAACKGGANRAGAKSFVDFVTSSAGQRTLAEFGFQQP